jgi:hypothetical protein
MRAIHNTLVSCRSVKCVKRCIYYLGNTIGFSNPRSTARPREKQLSILSSKDIIRVHLVTTSLLRLRARHIHTGGNERPFFSAHDNQISDSSLLDAVLQLL